MYLDPPGKAYCHLNICLYPAELSSPPLFVVLLHKYSSVSNNWPWHLKERKKTTLPIVLLYKRLRVERYNPGSSLTPCVLDIRKKSTWGPLNGGQLRHTLDYPLILHLLHYPW